MLIRHRSRLASPVEVSNEQTPKWFIGLDGATYSKVEYELAPPPGQWVDITDQVTVQVLDSPAQGRVNFYFNESGTHEVRIGYVQMKGSYRVAPSPQGLKVEQRVDNGPA